MEEVGEKLKNMFSFGKSKKFTGHGHKLGGSESVSDSFRGNTSGIELCKMLTFGEATKDE